MGLNKKRHIGSNGGLNTTKFGIKYVGAFNLPSALHEWYRPNATDVGTTVTAVDTGSIGGLNIANQTAAGEPDFNANTLGFDGVQQELYNGVTNFRSGDSTGVIHVKFKATDNTSNNNYLFSIGSESALNLIGVRYKSLKPEFLYNVNGVKANLLRGDDALILNSVNTMSLIVKGSSYILGINGVSVGFTMPVGSDDGTFLNSFGGSDNIVMGGSLTSGGASYGKSDIYGVWYEPYTTEAAALANGLDIQNNAT